MVKEKFYGMANDYMFHAVLQKNKKVLKHLLAVLLEIDVSEIISCEIKNPIELGKDIEAKDCILDIKLMLNGNRIINIEMQNHKEEFWTNRSLLYWARAYDSIESGESYGTLLPTYHIGIIDFELFKNRAKFVSEFRILDVEDQFQYSDKLCIKLLDLTQLERVIQESDEITPLMKWAKVFKAKTMEELESFSRDSEVFETMVLTLKELNQDEKIRMQCEARADYESRLASARHAGMELERVNTEREKQRAEQAEKRAEQAEKEIERLKKLLANHKI